jgi:hypothetical protein
MPGFLMKAPFVTSNNKLIARPVSFNSFARYWQCMVRKLPGEYNKDEEKQFDLLFRSTYPRVLGYLIKVSEQPEVAEDIAQSIYLQLWENRTVLPANEKEALYYLFTIARHNFYQYTRKCFALSSPAFSSAFFNFNRLHVFGNNSLTCLSVYFNLFSCFSI